MTDLGKRISRPLAATLKTSMRHKSVRSYVNGIKKQIALDAKGSFKNNRRLASRIALKEGLGLPTGASPLQMRHFDEVEKSAGMLSGMMTQDIYKAGHTYERLQKDAAARIDKAKGKVDDQKSNHETRRATRAEENKQHNVTHVGTPTDAHSSASASKQTLPTSIHQVTNEREATRPEPEIKKQKFVEPVD